MVAIHATTRVSDDHRLTGRDEAQLNRVLIIIYNRYFNYLIIIYRRFNNVLFIIYKLYLGMFMIVYR